MYLNVPKRAVLGTFRKAVTDFCQGGKNRLFFLQRFSQKHKIFKVHFYVLIIFQLNFGAIKNCYTLGFSRVIAKFIIGANEQDRTADLSFTKAVRYLLRHVSILPQNETNLYMILHGFWHKFYANFYANFENLCFFAN